MGQHENFIQHVAIAKNLIFGNQKGWELVYLGEHMLIPGFLTNIAMY